jgi:hypothetical protein
MRADVRLATTIDRLVRISAGLATFLGFLVVIPLTLWFAWTHHSTLAEAIIKTLFCISFGWMMVAILGWFRSFRALGNGASSGALLLGPCPGDSEQLRAWKWGRQFRYAVFAVLLSMIAFGVILWLNGE